MYPSSFVKLLQLIVTGRCNFGCNHCFDNGHYSQIDMKVRDIDLILERTTHHNLKLDEIIISGGEPTIHPDFSKLLRKVHDSKEPPVIDWWDLTLIPVAWWFLVLRIYRNLKVSECSEMLKHF